jgi:DNA-directed RNA polymerase specialized sigma24 family protein
MPFEQIASEMGLTSAHCRLIASKALAKARALLAERGIKPEDLLPDDIGPP